MSMLLFRFIFSCISMSCLKFICPYKHVILKIFFYLSIYIVWCRHVIFQIYLSIYICLNLSFFIFNFPLFKPFFFSNIYNFFHCLNPFLKIFIFPICIVQLNFVSYLQFHLLCLNSYFRFIFPFQASLQNCIFFPHVFYYISIYYISI